MKKILVLALIGIMVFSMTAWGAAADATEDESVTAEDLIASAILGKILTEIGYTPGDEKLAEAFEVIFDDVTEAGDFDPEDISDFRKDLFREYREEEERSVGYNDLEEAVCYHLMEETSEYLEAGDAAVISFVLGDLDENEDGTVNLLGYFTVVNFDADEENPADLLFKNGASITELLTLKLNEDGKYEVTDCITAEDAEDYLDCVAQMCEVMDIDTDVFYEEIGFCDFAFISDLHNFLIASPEYERIDYMGELVSHEDLDAIADEMFYDCLVLYGLTELVEGIDDAEAEEEAVDISVDTKTLQLGTSSFTIEIPESYEEGELSEEDTRKSLVAYMKSKEFDMDFDVYQFGKEGLPETIAELAEEEAKEYDTYEIETDLEINGIDVVYCRAVEPYEGKDYDTITYYLDDGDTYLEVEFWLDGDIAEDLSDMIISTLSTAK